MNNICDVCREISESTKISTESSSYNNCHLYTHTLKLIFISKIIFKRINLLLFGSICYLIHMLIVN